MYEGKNNHETVPAARVLCRAHLVDTIGVCKACTAHSETALLIWPFLGCRNAEKSTPA